MYLRSSTCRLLFWPKDDAVRPQTEDEKQLYQLLSSVTGLPASSLSAKWREPSLSVHSLEVSGPGSTPAILSRNESSIDLELLDATVIPARVKAKVSVRIVPDQDVDTISRSLHDYIEKSYERMQSTCKISVRAASSASYVLFSLSELIAG